MDNDKIASFLKELRVSSGLSQTDLANKLYVSRQAVSLWENGKNLPDIDKVNDLANLYNITIADIYAGEKLNSKKEENEVVSGVIKKEKNKVKKITIISLIIIILLIFSFLVYYFFSYYRNISVYIIGSNEDKYKVNGIINKSINQVYFNLEIEESVDNLCLIYKDNDINKTLLCRENSNSLVFKDSFDYKEYLPTNNFNDFINNVYLKVNDDEIKLVIYKDYQNDNLFIEKNTEIYNNKEDIVDEKIPLNIKKNFNYIKDDRNYRLELKKNKLIINMIYNIESEMFIVSEEKNNIHKDFYYDCRNNILIKYIEINNINMKIIKNIDDFSILDEEQKELIKYFSDNYVDKYLG